MTPTPSQIEILREVIGGKKMFAPRSDSDEDINSFQALAEKIIELSDNNFLTGCRPKRESYSGKRQIVRVLVAGVTAAGRRVVQPVTAATTDHNVQTVACPSCNHSLRAVAKFCDQCGFLLPSNLDSTLPMEPQPSQPTDSLIGQLLNGKYQITADIGKGGMGHVYRARHVALGKDVAIKMIHKQFVSDENAIKRFKREAKAAAQLTHSNIINIHDIDEIQEPDRRPYIVMELVEGKSLKQVLAAEGKLAIDRAIKLFIEICAGVSAAHRQGVIHRDIKPDNIMIIQRPHEANEGVKVLDFGLAKIREFGDQSAITHIGTVMGTPLYMSPEQCRGEELDERSDVYSLGTVLFEMISGAPPFAGSNVCSKHQFDRVPPFDSYLSVPQEIEKVIKQALAKDRQDRPPDVKAFCQHIQIAYEHPSASPETTEFAETVQAEESSAHEIELIPGLTKVDTLVLKSSCELALKTGDAHVIYTSKVTEALQQLGIGEHAVWESLELLNERGYIESRRIMGGGQPPFQVYSLKLQGFNEYARIFIPDYDAVIAAIIKAIVVNDFEDNFELSKALNRPILLINFVLDLLEQNGWLKQSKRLGGKSVIVVVTVELKRKAREIGARTPLTPNGPSNAASFKIVPEIESYRTSADNISKIDYYTFRVTLRNITYQTIRNFRLEVEIPNEYADPTHQGSMSENVRFVRGSVTVYRHTQDQFPRLVIYPYAVSPMIMNTNYQMRFDQYKNASGVIKVTVYVDDEMVGNAEYSIRENRNRDRMAQLGLLSK